LNGAGIELVQRWINSPAQNHGIAIQDFNNVNTDDLDFASSDASTPGTRPKITINVTLPSAPQFASLTMNPLQNTLNPHDVDNNGYVSPSDVLVVFNSLNRIAEGEEAQRAIGIFPDVSGDGVLSPLDALLVINYLNQSVLVAEGESQDCLSANLNAFNRRSLPVRVQPIFQGTRDATAMTDVARSNAEDLESYDSLFARMATANEERNLCSLDVEVALEELAAE
jgi:hypothetical protein